MLEEIFRDLGVRIELAMLRYTYANDLAAIRTQWGAASKIVIVNGVEIFPAPFIIEYYREQYAHIFFVLKAAVVEPVLLPIKFYPVIFIHSPGVIIVIDHAIRNTTVISEFFFVDPEADYRIITCIAVCEIQSIHYNMTTA